MSGSRPLCVAHPTMAGACPVCGIDCSAPALPFPDSAPSPPSPPPSAPSSPATEASSPAKELSDHCPTCGHAYSVVDDLEKARARIAELVESNTTAGEVLQKFGDRIITLGLALSDRQHDLADARETIAVLTAGDPVAFRYAELRAENSELCARVRAIAECGCTQELLAWSPDDLRQGLSCTPEDRCGPCRCASLLTSVAHFKAAGVTLLDGAAVELAAARARIAELEAVVAKNAVDLQDGAEALAKAFTGRSEAQAEAREMRDLCIKGSEVWAKPALTALKQRDEAIALLRRSVSLTGGTECDRTGEGHERCALARDVDAFLARFPATGGQS